METTTTDAAEASASHIRFCVSKNKFMNSFGEPKMNLPSNQNWRYFIYLALLINLVAVLVKFDGTVTVQVTTLGLQVQVKNHSLGCPIDPKIPDNIPPQPLQPELT
jgi:hypothetical protein